MRHGWWLVLVGFGCAPTFAPPIRSPHYGTPERLKQGDLEIAGAAAGQSVPQYGGPWVAYGVTDELAVEAGADVATGMWAMGFLGLRGTLVLEPDRPIHGAFDGAVDLGMGLGGERCGNAADFEDSCAVTWDGRTWKDRLALGLSVDGGAGLHIHWYSLYLRGRVQVTGAEGIPITAWFTTHGGMQFRIARTVDLFAGGGLAAFVNPWDRALGWSWDLGLAIHFSLTGEGRRRR